MEKSQSSKSPSSRHSDAVSDAILCVRQEIDEMIAFGGHLLSLAAYREFEVSDCVEVAMCD